jgi:ACT domain-containing protein
MRKKVSSSDVVFTIARRIELLISINVRLPIESMATAIDETIGKVRRLELLSKLDIEINVNDALLLTTEDGVLTALDDR